MHHDIGNRYRVESTLGRGGMAVVYRVKDDITGKTIALKQLRFSPKDSEQHRRRTATLFEHEYCTLAQLAHPCIITVYDYGTSQDGPYYTMELLQGEALNRLAPLDWRKACEVLREVCSSLALLHSRRLVHRDLTPRNLLCTTGGRTKLIDFGAMVPFGPVSHIVGTPAYLAPEAARQQPLDGRTDLFSLGAVAYWTLTKRHAFSATALAHLEAAWARTPPPPSTYADDIPQALDALVMSLLNLDPSARPPNAAEVIDRLSSIAGLSQQAELSVAQSYLTTPILVGRDGHLARFRKGLNEMRAGRGTAFFVEAPSGMGRTRLLQSFALESKLTGALVLQANARQLIQQNLGVARVLLDQLTSRHPTLIEETSKHGAAIRDFLFKPEATRQSQNPIVDPNFANARFRHAVVPWLIEVSRKHPVVVLVDDAHMADTASSSVLVELAAEAPSHHIIVAVSVEAGELQRDSEALTTIKESANTIALKPLDTAQTRQLIESVFGGVPNLQPVVDWVYQVAQGSPNTCMELAQHLVDRKLVRFAQGVWQLPDNLSSLELPASLDQAIDTRLNALSASARELAEVLVLATRYLPPTTKDYKHLLSEDSASQRVFAALDELVASNVLSPAGETHVFQHQGVVAALRRGMDEDRRAELHRRLADFYVAHDPQSVLIHAHHFLQAGDIKKAFWHFTDKYVASQDINTPSVMIARSPDGTALFHALIDYADTHQIPPGKAHVSRAVALKLSAVTDPSFARVAEVTLPHLVKDSGRTYYDETDPTLEDSRRIKACLEWAQATWENTPEANRGLSPVTAIQELAVCVATLCSVGARTRDVALIQSLPDLIEPFRVFPAVSVVHDIITMVRDSVVFGKYVLEQRKRTLQALAEPVAGIDELTRLSATLIITYYMGLDEAVRCDANALTRADRLEENPHYVALGWHVRALYYANLGNAKELRFCRQRRAVMALANSDTDHHLTAGLVYELPVLVRTNDLMALKEVLPKFQKDADLYPGWRPWAHYAEASYRDLLGEHERAAADYERGLALTKAGEHGAWAPLVEGSIHNLLSLNRASEALRLAGKAESLVRELKLHVFEPTHLAIAFALAEAHASGPDRARARLDAHLEQVEESGHRGLVRGALYEAQARVALLAADPDRFERFVNLMEEEYRPGRLQGLLARHQRLIDAAREAGLWNLIYVDGVTTVSTASDKVLKQTIRRLSDLLSTDADHESKMREIASAAGELEGVRAVFAYSLTRGLLHQLTEYKRSDEIALPPETVLSRIAQFLKDVRFLETEEKTVSLGVQREDDVPFFEDQNGIRYYAHVLPLGGRDQPTALVCAIGDKKTPVRIMEFLASLMQTD